MPQQEAREGAGSAHCADAWDPLPCSSASGGNSLSTTSPKTLFCADAWDGASFSHGLRGAFILPKGVTPYPRGEVSRLGCSSIYSIRCKIRRGTWGLTTYRRPHNSVGNLLDPRDWLARRHGLDQGLEVLRVRCAIARVGVVRAVVGLLTEVDLGRVQLPCGDVLALALAGRAKGTATHALLDLLQLAEDRGICGERLVGSAVGLVRGAVDVGVEAGLVPPDAGLEGGAQGLLAAEAVGLGGVVVDERRAQGCHEALLEASQWGEPSEAWR